MPLAVSMSVRWKPGRRFGVPAPVAYKALETLRSSGNGSNLEAKEVVKAARRANHPLHRCFTWDDDVAAENWRVHEARRLINSIEVVREKTDDEPRRVIPAFVANPRETGYLGTEDAMSDESVANLVVENALSYLRGFKVRYGRLREFKDVCEAIDRAAERARQR